MCRIKFWLTPVILLIFTTLALPVAAQYATCGYGTYVVCAIGTEEDPGTAVTSSAVLRAASTQIAGTVAGRISAALKGTSSGLRINASSATLETPTSKAAGDAVASVGAWISLSTSSSDDTLSSTAFDAETDVVMGGMDLSFEEKLLVGVAIGHESNDIITTFNAGGQDKDGVTVAPYIGYVYDENVSLDMTVGYSSLDIQQFRTAAGAQVTSTLDADRWFVAGNINAYTNYSDWLLGGRVGYLWAKEDVNSFTESDGTFNRAQSFVLGQAQVGVEAARQFGSQYGLWEPYATLVYEYDFSREEITVAAGQATPENDRDGVVVGAGLRYFASNGVSGDVVWNRVLGREDFGSHTLGLTIRAQF